MTTTAAARMGDVIIAGTNSHEAGIFLRELTTDSVNVLTNHPRKWKSKELAAAPRGMQAIFRRCMRILIQGRHSDGRLMDRRVT